MIPARLPLPTGFERIAAEVELYYRELPRLVDEKLEGKVALVCCGAVSVWDTSDDAMQFAAEKYGLVPMLIQPIDDRDIDRLAPYMSHPEGVPA